MKKIFIICNLFVVLCVLSMLTLTACGGGDDDDTYTPSTPEPTVGPVSGKDTSAKGSVSSPSWMANTDDIDPTNFMMISICADDLPVQNVSEADLMAAFVDDDCRAVVKYKEEQNGSMYYHLLVNSKTADEQKSSVQIVLQYYSNDMKKIYATPSITFDVGTSLGGFTTSFKPTWSIIKVKD